MSSPAKPQNVCTGCRSRKKKCDGIRPACTSCHKRGDLCLYAVPPSRGFDDPTQADWFPVGTTGLVSQSADAWTSSGLMTDFTDRDIAFIESTLQHIPQRGQQDSWQPVITTALQHDDVPVYLASSRTESLGQSSLSSADLALLPSGSQLLELAELFFDKFYRFLPLFHKETFITNIKSHGVDSYCPLLLFSVISISATAHPDRLVQQRQVIWFEEAKSRLSEAIRTPDHPHQTLQAAVCVIFQAMVSTYYSTYWMILGEAWRKAVAMGCNQQHNGSFTVAGLGSTPCESWIEKEECRRSIWTLFILNRGICCPVGLMHAIDDRQLRIDLPMPDSDFQTNNEPRDQNPIAYTSNIDNLISSVQQNLRQKSVTLFHLLVLAHDLLGRIVDGVNDPENDGEHSTSYKNTLTSRLVRIRLMLPRYATDLSAADYRDFGHVTWLNTIMNVCTILLHHQPLQEGETLDGSNELAKNWPYCVAAARGTVAMMRDAARISADYYINPHISSQLFTCGRILLIEYLCPSTTTGSSAPSTGTMKAKDISIRNDLEVIYLVFQRMKESLQGVGQKYSNALAFYLRGGEERAREAKAGGSRDFLGSCHKWPSVESQQECLF